MSTHPWLERGLPFHQQRIESAKDIDEIMRQLNRLSLEANPGIEYKGGWVCARVLDLDDDGLQAVFVHLDDYADVVTQGHKYRLH